MANVIIDDKHLYDIGDALRGHYGEYEAEKGAVGTPVAELIYHTDNWLDDGTWAGGDVTPERLYIHHVCFPGASRIDFHLKFRSPYGSVILADSTETTIHAIRATTTLDNTYSINDSVAKINVFLSDSTIVASNYGYWVKITAYDADGNPVLGGEYGDVRIEFKPREMAAAITELPVVPNERLQLKGSNQYRFSYNNWNWFLDLYGDKITTGDGTNGISSAHSMFYGSSYLEEVPFDIKISGTSLSSMFSGCTNLTKAPHIILLNSTTGTATLYGFSDMFESCSNLRDAENVFNAANLDILANYKVTSAYSAHDFSNMFNACYSLRKLPSWFDKLRVSEESTAYPSATKTLYYGIFKNCYALDEITNLPVVRAVSGSQTSNMFSYTFDNCYRIKEMTFETQDDGTPYTVTWSKQTIDLSKNVGYANTPANITNYNSGITNDKRVTDSATLAALAGDEDWWTTDMSYSRYERASAVNTINSLPDCSAGSSNVIKFKSDAGLSIYDGHIGSLTEEEIAVAAAKGWTVSLV